MTSNCVIFYTNLLFLWHMCRSSGGPLWYNSSPTLRVSLGEQNPVIGYRAKVHPLVIFLVLSEIPEAGCIIQKSNCFSTSLKLVISCTEASWHKEWWQCEKEIPWQIGSQSDQVYLRPTHGSILPCSWATQKILSDKPITSLGGKSMF